MVVFVAKTHVLCHDKSNVKIDYRKEIALGEIFF